MRQPSLLDKIYDSLYAPGPMVRTCAFLAGGYVGLAAIALISRKLDKN